MHNSFIKAIASSCSCDFDADWHERKMFKFVIPFLFKRLWEKRVCPKASGDTAMLWSIRVCDGFCIDHENVGWWSGLEGAVGWRWGGGGVVFEFPLMAATLHRRGKDPLELVCRRHRSYHSWRGHRRSGFLTSCLFWDPLFSQCDWWKTLWEVAAGCGKPDPCWRGWKSKGNSSAP